jgi:hypothetical protein
MQAIFRNQVDRAPGELLQILLQCEIGHAEIVTGKAGLEQVDITIWPLITARDRPEDRQLCDAVFLAQLSQSQP